MNHLITVYAKRNSFFVACCNAILLIIAALVFQNSINKHSSKHAICML